MNSEYRIIVRHLFEIAAGNCWITENYIDEFDGDSDFQNVLIGIRAIHDIIERKKERIFALEKEKIELNRELRDRVKNNMQIISSLFSLQSNYVDHEETRTLIRYCQYRIKSMSLIHEMLYKTNDLSKIEYGSYIRLLADQLTCTMKGNDHNVKLKFDISHIILNIETAIPLGLLLNEIITNSLKYGIKDNKEGEIYVSLKQLKYPNYILQIGDNGCGFENDVDFRSSESLGLRLIHKLTLQLKGNIEKVNNSKGTNYILTFQEIS